MRKYSEQTQQNNFQSIIGSKANSSRGKCQIKLNANEQEVIIGKYKYNLTDHLGTGYTSQVYKCEQVDNPMKKYAIKIIELKRFRGYKFELLEAEINIHKSLVHQHILKLYQIIKTPFFYYIILEYCPHGTLREYIQERKKLTEKNAIQVMIQLLEAYKFLIQQNILHRDLKPANILRVGNKWKISDFGFAIKSKYSFKDQLNVGTSLYMAPQSLFHTQYSTKTDIFALGVILYEMITGTTPWQCFTQKQLKENLKVPLTFDHEIKNGLIKQFISKACEIDEKMRMSKEQLLKFQFSDNSIWIKSLSDSKLSSIVYQKQTKSYLNSEQSTLASMNLPLSQIKRNHWFFTSEFQKAQLLYACINNIDSFLIYNQDKQIFILALFKYLLKSMKYLCDSKINQFNLHNWAQYVSSQEYKQLVYVVRKENQKMQKQFLEHMKNNQIKIIRTVNRKFPCLSHNAPLTARFYENFKNFMVFMIRQHNHALMLLFNYQEEDLDKKESEEKESARLLKVINNDCLKQNNYDKIQALECLYTLYNIADMKINQKINKEGAQDTINVVENFKKSSLRESDYFDLSRLVRKL